MSVACNSLFVSTYRLGTGENVNLKMANELLASQSALLLHSGKIILILIMKVSFHLRWTFPWDTLQAFLWIQRHPGVTLSLLQHSWFF